MFRLFFSTSLIKQADFSVEMKVKDGCQTKLGTKPQVRMPRAISWVSTAPSLVYGPFLYIME